MTRTPNPASLYGEALTRWYRRSHHDIERERQTLVDDRYAAFFGAPQSQPIMAAPASQSPSALDCVTCHGRTVPPSPMRPWPTWPIRPSRRDATSASSGEPPKGSPKQCEIQHQNDTEICGRQPNNVARVMCRESAMERYAYCIKSKGEVGHPRLFRHPNERQ